MISTLNRAYLCTLIFVFYSSIFMSRIDLIQCRNPMGRTGVRGRGALIRWGPNKSIMGAITRWKRHDDQFVIVDRQRILEIMVFRDEITNDWKLPDVSTDVHHRPDPINISFTCRAKCWALNHRMVLCVVVLVSLPCKMPAQNIVWSHKNET